MEVRLLLSLCLCTWGVSGGVDHKELVGEHPSQEDVDNGVCIPISCEMGVPPKKCKQLCSLRNYDTICQPPADFCLCQHDVHGKMTLVSPDEVASQLPDSSEVVDKPSEKPTVLNEPLVSSKVDNQLPEQAETEADEVSFHIYAVFLPIKKFLYESIDSDPTPESTADDLALGYETVNVHEGRLFWDFRYILTGLMLLMIALVMYELVMCAMQVYRAKNDLSIKCEEPEVKVMPTKEKILNV